MNAKHQFKYTYSDTDLEEYSPVEVTFEIPATATIPQMLRNFEQYLRACGYVFDGALDVVPDGYDIKDEFDGSLYEFEDEEPQGGCMADFDKGCGCIGDSITPEEYQKQRLKEWNEGIAKLDKEVKEQGEIRENISTRADELKEMNEHWSKLNYDQKMKIYEESLKESEDKYPIEPLYKKVGTLNKPSDSNSDNSVTPNENY